MLEIRLRPSRASRTATMPHERGCRITRHTVRRTVRHMMHSVRTLGLAALVGTAGLLAGCSESSIVATQPPTGVNNPNSYNTPTGAASIYYGAINAFRIATTGDAQNSGHSFVPTSGLLGDELTSGEVGGSNPFLGGGGADVNDLIDSRNETGNEIGGGISQLSYAAATPWAGLHAARVSAMTAIKALHLYAPDAPKDWIGHSFALWGMSEVMLADLFCSGIPLSTVDSLGVVHYGGTDSTRQVLDHAIQLFDSALVYAVDSTQYRYLADVGKGWALLDEGRYADAATAVHEVPTAFVYQNLHVLGVSESAVTSPNWTYFQSGYPISNGPGVVADRDGNNGLPYRSSNDPRVPLTNLGADAGFSAPAYGFTPLVTPAPGAGNATIASGIEARLIEAEAALQANDVAGWLSQLNMLRTTGNTTSTGCPATQTAPCAAPGTGGVTGLPVLQDPGTPETRVTLMFQERAYWLFLTGRRLGDMRRLIRQYGRSANQVFPVGPYPVPALGVYGPDVNLVPPISEQQNNPLYHGCINRDA